MTEPTMQPDDLYSSVTEGLPAGDSFTRGWLVQAIVRIRRELCWQWRNREPADRVADLLERQSTAEQRRKFFAEDPAASYLNERMAAHPVTSRPRAGRRGTFPWLVRELNLSAVEIFVTALAFASARDAAVGGLIAVLNQDARQQLPTLGLAQWLWDEPAQLLPLMSPAHPLFARGIVRRGESANDWNAPIFMPAVVAESLEGRKHCPAELERIANVPRASATADEAAAMGVDVELLASRMAHPHGAMHTVPVRTPFHTENLDAVRVAPALGRMAALTRRPIYSIRANVAVSAAILENAGTYCWLQGADLLLPSHAIAGDANWQATLLPFPIYVFAPTREDQGSLTAPALPELKISGPGYGERRALWKHELKTRNLEADDDAVRECAYRFRLDAVSIAEIASALSRLPQPIAKERLIAACQQQVGQLIGSQATLVSPRFRRDDLVLDAAHSAQFDQVLVAMRNVSRVHSEWGTGQAWSDAGVSAMFAGPPGSGKTTGAEVLAAELQLPMYRVDLSQVVNKYIGETEKNLRKLFDAAEQADLILFFDEAEALFGQRIQSRTANDRFANMEISYLLERMERFRGLAILATNRRKDLDEAFLRRLRYVIEFPLPGEAERMAIWKRCIPNVVSTTGIDFEFLAREFALSGGNIRSVVLNACLQSASQTQEPSLTMGAMMAAIDREYEKIGRPLTREQKMQWHLGLIDTKSETAVGTELRQ